MAEAMAFHKGIQEAMQLQIDNIYIEGDNLLIINAGKRYLGHSLETAYHCQRHQNSSSTLLYSLYSIHL